MTPGFVELLDSAQRSALHLETRDVYGVDEEKESFAAWKGLRHNPADRASWWRPWLDLVSRTVERGVEIRRARVVSEPVTEYIRYEHSGTFTNVAADGKVRWLPRRQAYDLALPGTGFWLIDERLIRFNHFSGDGVATEPRMCEDHTVVELCSSTFEAVWRRATPHEDYRI